MADLRRAARRPRRSTAGWPPPTSSAEAGLRLKFRTGGLDAAAFPSSEVLAGWIDAALDRETQFKCTAGLHRAVRHTGEDGFEHHGFLNVLLATRRAFDGASPTRSWPSWRTANSHGDRRRGGRRTPLVPELRLLLDREPWSDLRELGLVG